MTIFRLIQSQIVNQGERFYATEQPDFETLGQWELKSDCEATNGCWVEPDGTCQHGHPSWLLYLGLI